MADHSNQGFSRDEAFDWGGAGDVTAASPGALRDELARLVEEERALAGRLELIRGRVELVRAELAGRGLATVGAADLARVLLGEERGRGEA